MPLIGTTLHSICPDELGYFGGLIESFKATDSVFSISGKVYQNDGSI